MLPVTNLAQGTALAIVSSVFVSGAIETEAQDPLLSLAACR